MQTKFKGSPPVACYPSCRTGSTVRQEINCSSTKHYDHNIQLKKFSLYQLRKLALQLQADCYQIDKSVDEIKDAFLLGIARLRGDL